MNQFSLGKRVESESGDCPSINSCFEEKVCAKIYLKKKPYGNFYGVAVCVTLIEIWMVNPLLMFAYF